MYKLIPLLLVASLSTQVNAQESVKADSLSRPVYYPTLSLPDGEERNIVTSYRFEEARENLEQQITALKRKRKDTAAQERLVELCDKGIQGLKGTDKVVVIDSVVVDKNSFLSAYPTLKNLGEIKAIKDGHTYTYTTEMGNKMYEPVSMLTEEGETTTTFKCYLMENGTKVSSTILDGLEVNGELNYPFLMADGVTFYFSAISDEGYGNYDIYVTRYDSDDDRFYRADNLGFPFNSFANDYMLVVDEENGVGWFASDRYQPKNKVCVYTFIYSESRNSYDYESEDYEKIVAAASLRSIYSTWTEDTDRDRIKIRQKIALSSASRDRNDGHDFDFIINENFVYTKLSDFQNQQAREMFLKWQALTKEYKDNDSRLSSLRNEYARASTNMRERLAPSIKELEEKVELQIKQCHEMEKEVRKLENE